MHFTITHMILVRGAISLISDANNEVIDGRWGVEIFEDETIQFWDVPDLKKVY